MPYRSTVLNWHSIGLIKLHTCDRLNKKIAHFSNSNGSIRNLYAEINTRNISNNEAGY